MRLLNPRSSVARTIEGVIFASATLSASSCGGGNSADAVPGTAIERLIRAVELNTDLLRDIKSELASRREHEHPKNETEVTALAERVMANRQAALAKHFLWTRQDVYAAYGMPDSLDCGSTGQTTWYYLLKTNRLCIEFLDGLVVDISVHN